MLHHSEGRVFVKKFPGLKVLAILIVSLFTAGCATDKPPTGGPPDTSALTVISSDPEPGATNISPGTIRLLFSHYISGSELSKALFFSPAIRDYEISMHGKEAVVRVYDPLKPDQTYTLTLQKSLKSFYGNTLERSWILAFSTGGAINHGTIDGRVWTRLMAPASNITVMAFAPGNEESPSATPDYIVQTDASGTFRFENIREGRYHIIAFNDKNRNLHLDPAKEEFGVTATPFIATGSTGVALRLATGDTSPTTLRSANPVSNQEIEITFSRPLPSRSFDLTAIGIEDRAGGTSLPILGYFTTSRAEEEATYHLFTGPMNPRAQYHIVFRPQKNTATSSELTILGNVSRMEYPLLTLKILPSDKTSNVLLDMIRPEAGPSIEMQFNMPVKESTIKPSVTLTAIRRNATEELIPFSISRNDSRTWSIRPVSGFTPGMDYRVTVKPLGIAALTGGKSKDSVIVSRFSAAAPDQYGEITGTGHAAAATAVIEARRTGTTVAYRSIVKPSVQGTFSFDFHLLPPGNYTITGFIPSDAANAAPTTEWHSGTAWPFTPSDPFMALTVAVRAGWKTENIQLEIPATKPYSEKIPITKPAKSRPTKH